jgi:hypothetical protein
VCVGNANVAADRINAGSEMVVWEFVELIATAQVLQTVSL